MQNDNQEEALKHLYNLTNFLCRGYYEPKSDRDKALGDELHAVFEKYSAMYMEGEQ